MASFSQLEPVAEAPTYLVTHYVPKSTMEHEAGHIMIRMSR
jgi:hypothetical protein